MTTPSFLDKNCMWTKYFMLKNLAVVLEDTETAYDLSVNSRDNFKIPFRVGRAFSKQHQNQDKILTKNLTKSSTLKNKVK